MESWTVQVLNANSQRHMLAIQYKNYCFLSANTKLVAPDKAVRLSSEDLAQRFCEAVMPSIQLRHGDSTRLVVCHQTESRTKPLDDALVVARINENNFAPNKRPTTA